MFPIEIVCEAALSIIKKHGYQILVTGNASEQSLVSDVVNRIGNGATPLAGSLSLEELIMLIGIADCLITNNTGPAHIAAATGTPVIDLYARTNPEHTPWKVRNRVLYFDVDKAHLTKNPLLLS